MFRILEIGDCSAKKGSLRQEGHNPDACQPSSIEACHSLPAIPVENLLCSKKSGKLPLSEYDFQLFICVRKSLLIDTWCDATLKSGFFLCRFWLECLMPQNLDEAVHKANVLVEALGWIRQFRDRHVVIKLGGSPQKLQRRPMV
jgi:hypothetical protein